MQELMSHSAGLTRIFNRRLSRINKTELMALAGLVYATEHKLTALRESTCWMWVSDHPGWRSISQPVHLILQTSHKRTTMSLLASRSSKPCAVSQSNESKRDHQVIPQAMKPIRQRKNRLCMNSQVEQTTLSLCSLVKDQLSTQKSAQTCILHPMTTRNLYVVAELRVLDDSCVIVLLIFVCMLQHTCFPFCFGSVCCPTLRPCLRLLRLTYVILFTDIQTSI